jgi:HEAT repeat protein
LGKIGSAQAVPVLCKSLGDKDKTHRKAVAWALGEIRSGETISAVLPLLGDRDSSVRAAAADAVRKMCPDQEVPMLINAQQIREKPSDVDAPANVLRYWQPFVESLERLAGLCKDM